MAKASWQVRQVNDWYTVNLGSPRSGCIIGRGEEGKRLASQAVEWLNHYASRES